ncbi:hypothetical protein CPB86DRAFT_808098 [Serendipita vermifera]|nr:hypothetical protein CPB86DRAFT_808098 [Serendipita vermifera]
MKTVLGKRARSYSNSTIASSISQVSASTSATCSPTHTPNKRKCTRPEDSSDANKENIPPLPQDAAPTTLESRPIRGIRRTATSTSVASRTPARRQLARAESTPVIELGNLQLATPPVTPSKTNSSKTTPYAEARALLRTSSSASSAGTLTGRDAERTIITEFLAGSENTCLYISGTPGTGKTALVNDILKEKDDLIRQYVNCTGMKAEQIKDLTRQTRDERSEEGKTIIMILDELEELKGDSLASLLSIATDQFRIIGISNTHTLTTKPTASTITLHFKPYTSQEMTDIISKRLEAVLLPEGVKSIIVPSALSFACRKVSSQTGDLRACLALVRGAIETAEKEHIKKVLGNKGEEVPIIPASMAHVISATKAVTTQAPGTASVVRQLNLQARLVLLSLLLATRRLSASLSLINSPNAAKSPSKTKPAPKTKTTEALSEDSLFSFYTELLTASDSAFHAVSRSECADLLGLLETQGLVERSATGAGAKGKAKKGDKSAIVTIPSASREEEIVNGLTVTPEGQIEGPTEREIRSIWNKETTRIKREVEDRELVMKKRKDAFEDAHEG